MTKYRNNLQVWLNDELFWLKTRAVCYKGNRISTLTNIKCQGYLPKKNIFLEKFIEEDYRHIRPEDTRPTNLIMLEMISPVE